MYQERWRETAPDFRGYVKACPQHTNWTELNWIELQIANCGRLTDAVSDWPTVDHVRHFAAASFSSWYYSASDCLVWWFRIGVRHFALSTSLAITRYTSLPCPRCNICCFCNLNALFTVYFVSYIGLRLIILHIDCILVFIVCYLLFVFFLSITRWWMKLLNMTGVNILLSVN